MTVGLGISPGLLELAVRISVWASLAAPEPIPVRATVWRVASSLMIRLPIALSVGGSFTGLTVKRKLRIAVSVPSLTVTVIVALPTSLVAGVSWRFRASPLPLNTILALGTRTWLEE